MNKAILAPALAVIVSFGLSSQAFGHTGTQADPLPSGLTAYGQSPLANGECPAGFTKLYVRTQATNDPVTLQTICFKNSFVSSFQSALYPSEAAPAPAAPRSGAAYYKPQIPDKPLIPKSLGADVKAAASNIGNLIPPGPKAVQQSAAKPASAASAPASVAKK